MNNEEFIKNSDNWPMWPTLPMKNNLPQFRYESAFIHVTNLNRIYFANMFAPAEEFKKKHGKDPISWEELLKEIPHQDYDSIKTFLKEWQID